MNVSKNKQRVGRMKKIEIVGSRVKLVLYVQNFYLICEVYIDNQFIEKFQYPILELLKVIK